MPLTFYFPRHVMNYKMQWIVLFFSFVFPSLVNAATYNFTSGSYPPCSTNWNVSGTTYTCNGNGRVTLASGDILTSNTTITISANNGFSLNNNTIGSSGNRINLISTYGTHDAAATTTVWGNLTSDAAIALVGTTVNGTVITNATINLTGGGVTGLVRSNSNTITTNGTNLSGGASAQSGMSITGGTLTGNFVMTSNNAMTLSGVVMTSGSISGANRVTIQGGSILGSGSANVNVSTTSNEINVNNSIVYGNLTAASSATVNVTNGATIYGTCSPNSTPANACGATPPPPLNCPAGVSSGITGTYYNNRTLTEPSVASRSDAPIDFNWGAAAPGPIGINADSFSTRWTGYVRVTQSGSYRFQTVSDDGVRLSINGTQVINRWNDHSSATDTTADILLVAGQAYTLVLEYYEGGGDAVIRLQWRLPGAGSYVAIPGGPIPTLGAGLYECTSESVPPITSCSTTLSAGITGNYFNNQTLTNPVTSRRLDGPINFDWGTGAPGPTGIGDNSFSVRWEGYIRVTQSGVHRFQTNSDDGVRLTVNGNLLIDQWNDHSVTAHTSAAVNLAAGTSYPIKLEFYENGGYAVAQLHWQTPGSGSYVAIPIGINASPVSAPGLYECVTVPASYDVTNNATGLTCAAEQVIITARNAAGVVYNPPAGTLVTLSTTPNTGVWVGGNTFTFTGGESSFIKYLQQTTPATLVINTNLPTSPTSPSITFADVGLKIAGNFLQTPPASPPPVVNQIAGVPGTARLKVIRKDNNTGACVAQVGAGIRSVSLAYSCVNPDTCVAGQTFTVNGSGITANNKNAATLAYTAVNLTFDINGEAPLPINYSDVGQVNLSAQLLLTGTGNNPTITLTGSSDLFVVKPHTIAVSSARRLNGTVNPGGTTATGTTAQFVAAGEQFRVLVEARNGAAPAALTPNFGRELSPETQNLKIKTKSLVYPVGGTATALTVSSAIAATTPQGTFLYGDVRWDQVGSILIEPHFDDGNAATTDDGDYLGAGNIPNLVASTTVGRFYPDHFAVANSSLVDAHFDCAFSYMEQPLPFNYRLEARAVGGTSALSNYGAAYANNITPTLVYVAESNDSGVDLGARVNDGVTKVWTNGAVIVAPTNAVFSRLSTAPYTDGPYINTRFGIKLTDVFDVRSMTGLDMNANSAGSCSAASCTAKTLGSAINLRYGRLRLDDAFGPETAILPVNFATEYWAGSFFVTNPNDSCTKILRSAITYQPPGNILTPANLTVPLTGGTTTGSYSSISATEINFTGGSAQHFFTAPTNKAQGAFNVDVDLTSYPWLRFDWNQDGNHSDISLPTARFGFGSYRGHDRIIYWRERFN